MTDQPQLAIPDQAVEGYFVCGCSESGIRAGYKTDVIEAIVAAERRRLANHYWNRNVVSVAGLRHWLSARADQLDGGTR